MKRNSLSVRATATAIAMLCGALLIPSTSFAGGAVKVNGGQVCASGTTISLDPAGDLVISCNPPGNTGGGGPTSAPVCTINVSATPITLGQSTTLTAICSPAATGFTWSSATGPAIGNASFGTVSPGIGTYAYTLTGSNSVGSGPASPAVSVQVNAATIGGSGCVATAVAGAYAGNSTKLIAIDRGATVAYSLPIYNSPGRTLEILSIQSTASQGDLTSEFSVSTCPGDFTTMQAECKTWGTVNQSGTQLYATTSGSQVAGTCTVALGTQYYINARNTKFDRVTPACTPQTCYMNVQLNSY